MVREKPPTAPPPPSHTERMHHPHISLTQPVISSLVPPQTNNGNPCYIRFEFTTRHHRDVDNYHSVTTLMEKLLSHLRAKDPTLVIYPTNTWPQPNITASSNTNHTEKLPKNTEKTPTLTTLDTVPSNFTLSDKYFQYAFQEYHPNQTTVVCFYSAGSKTTAALRNPATTAFLQANKMWVHSSNFSAPAPNTTTFMCDTSSDTTTTQAPQLSPTEATIDRKLATFRNGMKFLISSANDNIYRHFLVPLLEKYSTLTIHVKKVLAAPYLSTTNSLIDHKLATFRTYMNIILSPLRINTLN
jgi:hypothetical protein